MSLQKEELAAQAVDLFKSGLYCSEAILKVFNEDLDLGLSNTALKMATGFGAGLGASKCCWWFYCRTSFKSFYYHAYCFSQ